LQEHQQELLPPLPQKGTREYRAKNEAKREESRAVLRRNSSGSTCLVAADAKNNSILAKTQDLSQLLLLFPSHAVSLNLVQYHSDFAAADQPFLAHPRIQLLQITNPFATNILRKKKPRISTTPCHSTPPRPSTPPNPPECGILGSSFAESDPLVDSQKMSHRPDNIHERTKSSNNNNKNSRQDVWDDGLQMVS
jgi:hypothetical protein